MLERARSKARYGVPLVVVLGVAAAGATPALSGASAPPSLPAITAQQLLADIAAAKAPALTGTLAWSANLGLSGLQSLQTELGGDQASSAGFNPASLLAGNYTLNVWLDGTTAEHVALITGQDSEVDLVRSGNQAWLWDSTNQSVLHILGPATSGGWGSPAVSGPLPTPEQVAANVLSALSPTTSVTVGNPVWVAGEAAYQLVVAPKAAPDSTVRQVDVAVGANGALKGVPLQVAVYAKGLVTPALQLGFTGSITLGVPPASELSFTPPPGSTVVTRRATAKGFFNGSGWQGVTTSGSGWATVLEGSSSTLAGPTGQAQLAPFTTEVEVGGQPARLLSTYLLNVLVLADGHFYAGFVGPSTLEALGA